MASKRIPCIKRVGGLCICKYCQGAMIKYGKNSSGEQRFQCKQCKRTQLESYKSGAYLEQTNQRITEFLKEGCGIRSIGGLLQISNTTVIKRIKLIAKDVQLPPIVFGKEYEVDELRTFVLRKSQPIWVVYALDSDTKSVVSIAVGNRTKKTIKQVIDTLVFSKAKKVYTDKLPSYKSLLPQNVHSIKFRGTNHIERKHLSLRTHLKRLNRRSICFSKSLSMLLACLRIYFWT